MAEDEQRLVPVVVVLTAYVDPNDAGLWDVIRKSQGSLRIADVVRAEIQSNLESVSYVRRLSIA